MIRVAATFLICAALFATIESACVRLIGERLSLGQMLMVRAGFQVLLAGVLGGLFTGRGTAMLRTKRIGGHFSRGFLASVSWWCYFMSFRSLDLPLATTLSFSSQLFLLLLAWPVLGERITGERVMLALIGFAGVLVAVEIWQPTGLDWRVSYGLVSACLGATMVLITRSLSFTERTETIMFYMAVMVFLSAAPQAWLDWRPVQPGDVGILVLLSITGTMGTFCMVEAYRRAEASALAPYPYSRLVFAAILGHFLFNDPLKPATLAGAGLIALSNLLPFIRARRAQRRQETAPRAGE